MACRGVRSTVMVTPCSGVESMEKPFAVRCVIGKPRLRPTSGPSRGPRRPRAPCNGPGRTQTARSESKGRGGIAGSKASDERRVGSDVEFEPGACVLSGQGSVHRRIASQASSGQSDAGGGSIGMYCFGPGFAVQGHEGARPRSTCGRDRRRRHEGREIGDAGGRARRRLERQVAAFTL